MAHGATHTEMTLAPVVASNSPRLSLRAEATERQRRGRSACPEERRNSIPNYSNETNSTSDHSERQDVISSEAKGSVQNDEGLAVVAVLARTAAP